MQKLKRAQQILLAYNFFMALASLLTMYRLLSSPSEPGSAILFGLSTLRLLLTLGLFFVFIFSAIAALKVGKDQAGAEQILGRWFGRKDIGRAVGWLSSISFGLGWIGCFLPVYRVGTWSNYWVRVQPVMVFILLASLATLIVFFIVGSKLTIQDLKLAPDKWSLALFLACVLLLGWMFYSGFGVVSSDDYWYGVGVPMLASQLIATITCGILFLYFESTSNSKRRDIFVCLLIFILTAFIWASEPLQESFLFTGPYAPNNVLYPFSDAAIFDAASQFALIGQKLFIFNSVFFERPLYLSFLVYLHSVFGQNYETLMAVQAGLFASLPVLIYLIGRSLNIRAVGFAAAIVAMLRGANSISGSNMIDMANPKMMLTDFPTAIGIAIVILLTCEWLNQPEKKWHYPIWIGGAIGFTLMLRTNALILLAFIPFYIFLIFSSKWRIWLATSFLIFIGIISITLPWELRNQSLGGQLYGPIVTKFQNVIKQRYQPAPKPESLLPREDGFASALVGNTQVITALYQDNKGTQSRRPCDTVLCFSLNHFLHNIVTSILIFPTSQMLDDLRHLIKERNPHYWQASWDGTFTGTAPLLLILNLYFITSGIAFAWKEKRLPGILPLAVFIVYNISNGLARTSGGRYIVPVDWIIPIYYLLGIFQVIIWFVNTTGRQWQIFSANSEPKLLAPVTVTSSARLSKALVGIITLLLFGSLLPLSETLHLPRYQNLDPLETLSNNRSLIEDADMKIHDLDRFLQSPNADILLGRALYPRYLKRDQGDVNPAFYPYIIMGFPRTAFKLIGPVGERSVVLPGVMPSYFPHTSDVLVLGCNGRNYFDALVVIVLDDNKAIYTRAPESELQCPLKQPVCNNNSVCN